MGNAVCKEGALLPELLLEIVARLAVPEILRLSQVCKSWRDLIRDPRFLSLLRSRNLKSTAVLVSGFGNGTFLLHEHSSSWLISPDLPCPTHPSGILLAAAGGLVCYAIGDELTREIDFVVCNPVTKAYLQLPTLHTRPRWHLPNPNVTMVVRHGKLHQLWVDLQVAVCFYDCFISKSVMERRIANSGKLILPLPNLWMEFFIELCTIKYLTYFDSTIVIPSDDDVVVDVDDFSISRYSREFAGARSEWIIEIDSMFESMGKLLNCWKSATVIRVCLVTFIHNESSTFISRHEPLFDINNQIIPHPQFFIVGFHDKFLISCPDVAWDFMFDDIFGSSRPTCFEDAARISNPSGGYFRSYRLELSLTDLPGSLASEDDFNWDMVDFPEENQELQALWVKRPYWSVAALFWDGTDSRSTLPLLLSQ